MIKLNLKSKYSLYLLLETVLFTGVSVYSKRKPIAKHTVSFDGHLSENREPLSDIPHLSFAYIATSSL